jgi:hypothetical protein
MVPWIEVIENPESYRSLSPLLERRIMNHFSNLSSKGTEYHFYHLSNLAERIAIILEIPVFTEDMLAQ